MGAQLLLSLSVVAMIGIVGILLIGGGSSSANNARVDAYIGKKSLFSSLRAKAKTEGGGSRRKQVEESLKKIEEAQKGKKKKLNTIESKLVQANVSFDKSKFLIVSAVLGLVGALAPLLLGLPFLLSMGLGVLAGLLLPRAFLGFLITRRQKKFIAHFADGMDIIVRGVRTGLPLGDCLKIIAHESPDPMGAEFRRVVEAEGVGVPIEICLEQMYQRMPVSEVNFFATVLNIQKTTGGNLAESLSNLSNVLRSRKILAEKIKALSAEAKMSAIIIGALPIVVMGLVSLMAPDYMVELFQTERGQKNLMIGGAMMAVGIFTMRKMINFKY